MRPPRPTAIPVARIDELIESLARFRTIRQSERVLAPVAVDRPPSSRDRRRIHGLRRLVHLRDERDRRDGVRHARVRQPWKTGPQHRGLRLVRDQVRSMTAVPLHNLQGHAEREHGDRRPQGSTPAASNHREGSRNRTPNLASPGRFQSRQPAEVGRSGTCGRPTWGVTGLRTDCPSSLRARREDGAATATGGKRTAALPTRQPSTSIARPSSRNGKALLQHCI